MRILVPVDGSDASLNALRYALGLRDVHKEGIHIEVLNVQPSMRAAVAQFIDKHVIEEFHTEQGEEALIAAKAMVDEAQADYDVSIVVGGVAEAIVEQAHEKACDAIVMGRSGLEGVAELLLGSTTNKVLQPQISPLRLFPDRVSSRHHSPLAS